MQARNFKTPNSTSGKNMTMLNNMPIDSTKMLLKSIIKLKSKLNRKKTNSQKKLKINIRTQNHL
jgi:hypothetical protein